MRFAKKLISRKVFGLLALALMLSLSVLAFEGASGAAPSAKAWGYPCGGTNVQGIDPRSFTANKIYPLNTGGIDNGDKIQWWFTNNPNPYETKVVMTTSSNVTWWKEVALGSNNDNVILARDYTQDGKHTATVSSTESGDMCVQLSKAKAFGVHTPMYNIDMYGGIQGKIVYINWLHD
jgi:hypothetical protein